MFLSYVNYNFILCNSLKPVYEIPSGLEFSVEEYIKSQIHFPLMSDALDRDFKDYLNALAVVDEDDRSTKKLESFNKVLKYFYTDLAEAITNGYKSNDFEFSVKSNLDNILPKEYITVDNIGNYVKKDSSEPVTWAHKTKILQEFSKNSNNPVLLEMR